MIFADENDKPINEILLAPGEKKKIRILLTEHTEAITRAFQAQWNMYDSRHQRTTDVTCKKSAPSNHWIFPLGPSTSDNTIGGLEGNTLQSAQPESEPGAWRCVALNSRLNQFWRPRGEFNVPVAVAEFTIQAPKDWNDDFATFELDTEYTLFIQSPDSDNDHYKASCNYDMVLTIKNNSNLVVPNNILPPKMSWSVDDSGKYLDIVATGQGKVKLVVDDSTSRTENGSSTITIRYGEGVSHTAKACIVNDDGNPITEWAMITIPAKKPASDNSKSPVFAFADADDNLINEVSLAPGKHKTIRIILTEHPEAVTMIFKARWIMYDSRHHATDDVICMSNNFTKTWISPLNLSTSIEDEGGLKGNSMTAKKTDVGTWAVIGSNTSLNQFWYPRGRFVPPIAVAEIRIEAPEDWNDEYATFELDSSFTEFVLTPETTPIASSHYNTFCNYSMVLTIKNQNK